MNKNNSSEDFWDLDDDDLDLDLPAPPEEAAPAPEEAPAPIEEPITAEVPAPAPPAEEPARIRVKGKSPRKIAGLSLIEKISILAVFLFLGGVAAWGISIFYKNAPQGELITFDTDFPIQGDTATVTEVETWWRSPIREGERADHGVRLQINLIPCARIKIKDTQNALLWVTFQNGEKDLVGDPINLVISNGTFLSSGSDEVEIHATSGFQSASEINAYTNNDIDPWSVVIMEGNNNEEFSTESDPLAKVRIEAKVPEETEVD
ncbi:hypothetical protein N9A94_03010 [Akkermansiaceae bacterium]|nr:hypothetical protein [Akkermansiaceae bacterium]